MSIWFLVIISALIVFIPLIIYGVWFDPEFRSNMKAIKESSDKMTKNKTSEQSKWQKTIKLNQDAHARIAVNQRDQEASKLHKKRIKILGFLSFPAFMVVLYVLGNLLID